MGRIRHFGTNRACPFTGGVERKLGARERPPLRRLPSGFWLRVGDIYEVLQAFQVVPSPFDRGGGTPERV